MKLLQLYPKVHLMIALTALPCALSCERQYRARLESYKPLTSQPTLRTSPRGSPTVEGHADESTARLAAASLILSREDLIPCASLPPRKLTTSTGQVVWVDGSWSNYARTFVVKGSAQSARCRIELHPTGIANMHLGGRDAFVRGKQIRILLLGNNGEAHYPPSNDGFVDCLQKDTQFEISYDNVPLGHTAISYVMNESIPLELNQRVCLARILDESQKTTAEWVLVVPTGDLATAAQLENPTLP